MSPVVEKWILVWFMMLNATFQQYFSNVVAVSFIGGRYREKITNLSQVDYVPS
jgi:hypothetical protein